MQNFFNTVPTVNYGTLHSPTWKYALAGLMRNLKLAHDYYHNKQFSVRSQHILVRFLHSLAINPEMHIERYYSIADSQSLGMAARFKMTSAISVGGIFNGPFYGKNSKEIILATNDGFDPYHIHRNWKTTSAVKPLLHPISDLSMMIPNGVSHVGVSGVAVIHINVPMLAVQYRAFCLEQYANSLKNVSTEATSHFVHRYVLPNMLAAQTDMALFNRFLNLLNGAPMTQSATKHPYAPLSYEKYVDKFFIELIDFFEKSDRTFENILVQIPSLTGTMRSTLMLPDYAPTRQVTWAEAISRIDAVDLLTQVAPEGGNSRNLSELNYFLREFKMIERDSIFNTVPEPVKTDCLRKIDAIRRRVGYERTA